MSEVKDPQIKLFGKTIEVPEVSTAVAAVEPAETGGTCEALSCEAAAGEDDGLDQDCSLNDAMLEDSNLNNDAGEQESSKNRSGPKRDSDKREGPVQPLVSEELEDSNVTPLKNEDSNALSAESDVGSLKTSRTEEDQSDTSNSQDKTLKKPDKILPCPRCSSMGTKFCYFNNYNVSQPRHFCKNCQRYWTAGGTMRNVPVGAGRRKNKSSVSQSRHLTIPEALQSARVDLPNGIQRLKGKVLTFSSDAPQCESMASVLNIADKTNISSSRTGVCIPGEFGSSDSHGRENGDDRSSSNDQSVPYCQPVPPGLTCFPGAAWPYPRNSVPRTSPVAPAIFDPSSFPRVFYSTSPPYWGYAIPGAWNVPWVIPPTPTSSQSHTPPCSGPNSPTLGKHAREDNMLKSCDLKEKEMLRESIPEKHLWVQKTLRFDDPEEAAKSSIWATLGIKNDQVDTVGSGLFKVFQSQSKSGGKNLVPETSTVLQANPAAHSRSLSFHESL